MLCGKDVTRSGALRATGRMSFGYRDWKGYLALWMITSIMLEALRSERDVFRLPNNGFSTN